MESRFVLGTAGEELDAMELCYKAADGQWYAVHPNSHTWREKPLGLSDREAYKGERICVYYAGELPDAIP